MNTEAMKLATDLTPEMKENLIAGVQPHEKRVVIHLAEASRIVNPDGTLRIYDDFVDDWRYTHSTFVHSSECQLCGKKNIREECHIEDTLTKETLTVGNECVYTHITIDTDGVEGLTGDAKRDFLKKAMNIAKKKWQKADFIKKYPNAWDTWNKVEHTYDKYDRAWCNRVTKQLERDGYLKAGTRRQWEDQFPLFAVKIAEYERRVAAGHFYTGHRTRMGAKSALVASNRNKDANSFRDVAEKAYEDGLIDKQQAHMISSIENAIRRYGIEGLRYANARVYQQIQRVIGEGEEVDDDLMDEGGILELIMIHSDKLTDWETDFMDSVIERNSVQLRTMSPKQRAVISRIGKKVKVTTPSSW